MDNKDSLLSTLVKIANPFILICGLFTYILGLGIVHYFGNLINWGTAILGYFLVLTIIVAKNFLSAANTHPDPIPLPRITKKQGESEPEYLELKLVSRPLLSQIALFMLLAGGIVTVILALRKEVTIPAVVGLCITFLLVYLSEVPPVQLAKRGYGELIEAILIANMIPIIAYTLQDSEVNPLLLMLTLPLTFIYLAYRIACSFEFYTHYQKFKTGALVVQMGWQKAMTIHNLSILLAFFLLAGFLLAKLSWPLAWPIFLALPFGILQIIQIIRIGDG